MPTENRSSNTEMVLVPRELTPEMRQAYEAHSLAPVGPISKTGYLAMLDAAPAEQPQGEPRQERCDTCHGLGEVATGTVTHHGYNQPPEPDLEVCPECSGEQRWYVAGDIDRLVRELDVLLNGDGAAPQAKLCDLVAQVAASKKHPGEQVAWVADVVMHNGEKIIDGNMAFMASAEIGTKLYTHADPGKVERLRDALDECDGDRWKLRTERDTLRAQLAERGALLRHLYDHNELSLGDDQLILAALSASAEPSAPVERDERADCENCDDTGLGPCTVCAALERKP